MLLLEVLNTTSFQYLDCGTYITDCGKAWIGEGSSKKTTYVTCGLNGFVSHYDIVEESFSDDKCEGEVIAKYQYLYRTKKYDDQTDISKDRWIVLFLLYRQC